MFASGHVVLPRYLLINFEYLAHSFLVYRVFVLRTTKGILSNNGAHTRALSQYFPKFQNVRVLPITADLRALNQTHSVLEVSATARSIERSKMDEISSNARVLNHIGHTLILSRNVN